MTGLTHQQFVAGLAPQTRQNLLTRSNRAGLLHLAGHVGVLALTGGWVILALPGWPLALLVYSVALIFLFTLLHETTHETPFASKPVNDIAGTVAGFVLLVPFRWFTWFHLAHHRFTQDPDRDPELAAAKPATWPQYLRHLSGLPTWWAQIRQIVVNATGRADDPFVPARRKPQVVREARVHLALYAAIAGLGSVIARDAVIWLWLVPALIGQPVLRAYLLAEHTRCAFVANMLENTRTTYTTRFIRFIAWNMPYHIEHHTYPQVPFHKLPALHALLRDHLAETEDGYIAFHRKLTSDF